MKRLIYLLLLLSSSLSYGQDIPLYTQKLTNSVIYNPAIAGHTFGSLTYSFTSMVLGSIFTMRRSVL